MINQIIDSDRIAVECRHRWRDDCPHAAQRQHVLEMYFAKRCFPDEQNEATPLLERDIGRPRNQFVGIPMSGWLQGFSCCMATMIIPS